MAQFVSSVHQIHHWFPWSLPGQCTLLIPSFNNLLRSGSFRNSLWLLSRIRWNYIKFLCNNKDFEIQRRGRLTRTSKNNYRFYKQNNNFARTSGLFVHFFARFCTTTTWKCLISHVLEWVNKQRRSFISFSEPLDTVPRNSTLGESAYTWQSKWVGIIAIKTERTQIHF